MGILIFSILMIIAGVFIAKTVLDDILEFMGVLLAGIGGMVLLIALITVPLARMGTQAFIQQMQETKSTYDTARLKGNNIETAAIQVDIAEMNRYLASKKYYNTNYFDLWCPDEIDKVQPIK